MLIIFYAMKDKRILIIIIASIALLIAALSAANGIRRGSLRVQTVNAYTMEPIAGAYVVVAECKASAYTDSLGFAYLNDIPLLPNKLFADAIGCAWGEASLFAYAEGYLPYALLHAAVYDNTLRLGPTLYLFPEGETGVNVTTISNPPRKPICRGLLSFIGQNNSKI